MRWWERLFRKPDTGKVRNEAAREHLRRACVANAEASSQIVETARTRIRRPVSKGVLKAVE